MQVPHPRAGSVAAILVPSLVFGALLLTALLAVVTNFQPDATLVDVKPADILYTHQRLQNFITAKKEIAKRLSSTPIRWSAPVHCRSLRNGIWDAIGNVYLDSGASPSMETPTAWRVVFVPSTSEVIFLMVGTTTVGSLDEANRRLNAPSGEP